MTRQKVKEKVLKCIVEYIKEHGYPPTSQEICGMTNLKSKASVHEYLRQLMMDGAIESDDEGKARAIRVSGYVYIRKEEERRLTVAKIVKASLEQDIQIERGGMTVYCGRAADLEAGAILESTIEGIEFREKMAVLQIA